MKWNQNIVEQWLDFSFYGRHQNTLGATFDLFEIVPHGAGGVEDKRQRGHTSWGAHVQHARDV